MNQYEEDEYDIFYDYQGPDKSRKQLIKDWFTRHNPVTFYNSIVHFFMVMKSNKI